MTTSSSSEESWPLVFDNTMAYTMYDEGLRTPESSDFNLLPYIPDNYYAQQQVIIIVIVTPPQLIFFVSTFFYYYFRSLKFISYGTTFN